MKEIKIKKGLDIPLIGAAEKALRHVSDSEYIAVKPIEFKGLNPKLVVKEGDKVKAGSVLFFDKNDERIKVTAPYSGMIERIERGEKRVIEKIVVKLDKTCAYEKFEVKDIQDSTREELMNVLLDSGLWTFIRQRPYDAIANPDDKPKAIFISTFDTSPLAPDYDFIMHGKGVEFQMGIEVLNRLSEGKVHLSINAKQKATKVFTNSKNVQFHYFSGPHPSGNVGVQIHHVSPINKGEVVWYIKPQEVAMIGNLYRNGFYDSSKIIALTGSEVVSPVYIKTFVGVHVLSVIKDNIKQGNQRYISGNVLTGQKIERDGFLGYYHDQLTVIPEGDYYAFMGWASVGIAKHSMSHSFLSSLFPWKKFRIDTNLNGGQRPFVVTGQYEKVLPMDIYPVPLLKAILNKDVDKMEKLGIYECSEEDFALCEYICTSKIEVQRIIREGLDLIKQEMS